MSDTQNIFYNSESALQSVQINDTDVRYARLTTRWLHTEGVCGHWMRVWQQRTLDAQFSTHGRFCAGGVRGGGRASGGPPGPLGGVTPKLSFQPTGSISSVLDYGATVYSGKWQRLPWCKLSNLRKTKRTSTKVGPQSLWSFNSSGDTHPANTHTK